MNTFNLPIGDWSGDGHGIETEFWIESNKTVQEVRELYFQACDKIGFSLDGSYKESELTPMSEYEDNVLKEETLNALLDFGVKIDEKLVDELRKMYKAGTDKGNYIIEADELCKIILEFIKTQDEELVLKIIPKSKGTMFQFYGCDNKNRHIGYFGYGLFR